jgi:thioredoxin reductase
MKHHSSLPVAVIGAGPVGLAAAAHLLERHETPLVLEAGAAAAETVRQWAHVRMFSPWRYTIDAASRRLLQAIGWSEPEPADLPTGGDLVSRYLEPLATRTALRNHIIYHQRVIAISRQDTDKLRTRDRGDRPFVIRTAAPDGTESQHLARAVIDASGTWSQPNPIGADGFPTRGETAVRDVIVHGIPDVMGRRRAEFAGNTTLVVGSGHSAFNAVLDLLSLKEEVPDTRVIWAMRRASLDGLFGTGQADVLPARGGLGQRTQQAVASGSLTVISPFHIRQLARTASHQVTVTGENAGRTKSFPVDRIIVATGFRPDLTLLREVRVDLDPSLESARELGPLIDPNVHSCGSVRPHGARELTHPEKDFYIVGMKSYGRAPTFLLATGYEQVRSVVAELAGDHDAAMRVELVLPANGHCELPGVDGAGESCCGNASTPAPRDERDVLGDDEPTSATPPLSVHVESETHSTCCGGPAQADATACCALDEQKKAAGESGCGCAQKPPSSSVDRRASVCC